LNVTNLAQMSHIAENISRIKAELGPTQLIVVSKYRTVEEIQEAYNTGQRAFAENRVQALLERAEALPKDIEWDLIGHLQTNKAKYIAPFIHMIHSIDSLKLLEEVNKQAEKCARVIDCLLQVHVAMEETKFGFSEAELLAFLQAGEWKSLAHVRICGLMAMASNTEDKVLVQSEFARVQTLFQQCKQQFFATDDAFQHISTGMSSDYPIAIKEGSTMVRVGSAVFG
jgi:PLP dependent protein